MHPPKGPGFGSDQGPLLRFPVVFCQIKKLTCRVGGLPEVSWAVSDGSWIVSSSSAIVTRAADIPKAYYTASVTLNISHTVFYLIL